jgi:hypothetical protein
MRLLAECRSSSVLCKAYRYPNSNIDPGPMEGSTLARSGDLTGKMKMGLVECCAVIENVGMNVRYRSYCTTRKIIGMVKNVIGHPYILTLFCIFFGGLECVDHSFAYVANLRFLRDV